MKTFTKIQKAIKFAIKTHEVYAKQKRKGKDISYITHPLTVGLMLSVAGADEDVVCAGILHDTIEDSIPDKKVDFDMLEQRFGSQVANMVLDVTEQDKSLPWEERKKQAIEHIGLMTNNSLLVKSADIVSNLSELIEDYDKEGEVIFDRFNAPKDKKIKNDLRTINAITSKWSKNPLKEQLVYLADKLQLIMEQKRCLCDNVTCAKCLGVNCQDNNCKTHTINAKTNRKKYMKRRLDQLGQEMIGNLHRNIMKDKKSDS